MPRPTLRGDKPWQEKDGFGLAQIQVLERGWSPAVRAGLVPRAPCGRETLRTAFNFADE